MKSSWSRYLIVGLLLVGVVFATLVGAQNPQEEVCEFKLAASWEPPPVYHGNHFAPGGVGELTGGSLSPSLITSRWLRGITTG